MWPTVNPPTRLPKQHITQVFDPQHHPQAWRNTPARNCSVALLPQSWDIPPVKALRQRNQTPTRHTRMQGLYRHTRGKTVYSCIPIVCASQHIAVCAHISQPKATAACCTLPTTTTQHLFADKVRLTSPVRTPRRSSHLQQKKQVDNTQADRMLEPQAHNDGALGDRYRCGLVVYSIAVLANDKR